jgi:hypothetical protein
MEKDVGDVVAGGRHPPHAHVDEMRQALERAVQIGLDARAFDDVGAQQLGQVAGGAQIGVLLDELFIVPDETVRRAIGEHDQDDRGQ